MPLSPDKKYHSRYFHFKYTLEALKGVRGKILDVGCGWGGISAALKRKRPDLKIFGCDINHEIAEYFKNEPQRSGIRFFAADAQNLPFTDQEFAAVITLDVLEHLKNPKKALLEVNRVLKSDGIFHLVVPLEGGLTTFDGWLKKIFNLNLKKTPIGHRRQFSLSQVKKMLAGSGFEIKKIRFSYHFFYQLISLIYFIYLAVFQKGKYLALVSRKKTLSKIILGLTILFGWLIFLESSFLSRVSGQTAHITSYKFRTLSFPA